MARRYYAQRMGQIKLRIKMNIKLPKVTLVAISSVYVEETIQSLLKSCEKIDFFDCILLSHEKPNNLPEKISFVKINEISTINDYNNFCLFELTNYIQTEFALLIQYDGYVLRPNKWKDYFLDFDYIGAPWPDGEQWNHIRVGNGGFSLRSKKLLDAMNILNLPSTDNGTGFYSEDMQICNFHRTSLENYGIKYAPVHIAAEFSHELDVPENCDEPFGFHKYIK